MKFKLLVLLFVLAANCFAQEFPPPPPPPPPPGNLLYSSLKFDPNIHKPIVSSLETVVGNGCSDNLRQLKGSSIYFTLPDSYIDEGNVFKKRKNRFVKFIEFPKIFKRDFFIDSLTRGAARIDGKKPLTREISINGVNSFLIESYDPKFGFATGFLLTGSTTSDFLIQLSYDLTDSVSKAEMTEFIQSICFKNVNEFDPGSELKVTVDTSLTHFYPQRLGTKMLLYTDRKNYLLGIYSTAAKFQLMEIDDKEYSIDEIIETNKQLYGSTIDFKELKKNKFKSNGFVIETQELEGTSKANGILLNMVFGALKTEGYTVYFTGMCTHEAAKYRDLWNKTMRTVKMKKK
ncbi:MAG TPA: hypothetical protein VK177_16285 [Flavobacteriales bacterium]|nr:hypothetical protein [Flavobacteriales bacterium]